jgi:hypothetical protein
VRVDISLPIEKPFVMAASTLTCFVSCSAKVGGVTLFGCGIQFDFRYEIHPRSADDIVVDIPKADDVMITEIADPNNAHEVRFARHYNMFHPFRSHSNPVI